MIRRCVTSLIGFALVSLCCAQPASAGLVLHFDQSTYTIPGVGLTTSVNILVSQDSTGAQVGVGNELLSAGIELSYPTGDRAAVLASLDVEFGPSWDGGASLFGTNGSNDVVDIVLTSFAGIADLSTPLLLSTVTFTGLSVGSMPISVTQLDPNSPDFITVKGDILDPTNSAKATVQVSGGTVPEPGTLTLLSVGAMILATPWFRRCIK
jgi:hypothetical protein